MERMSLEEICNIGTVPKKVVKCVVVIIEIGRYHQKVETAYSLKRWKAMSKKQQQAIIDKAVKEHVCTWVECDGEALED